MASVVSLAGTLGLLLVSALPEVLGDRRSPDAEARGAAAGVAGHAVGAAGAVAAGVAGALVDVLLTEGALEAGQAVAEGRVDAVCAGAPIVARVCEVTGEQA